MVGHQFLHQLQRYLSGAYEKFRPNSNGLEIDHSDSSANASLDARYYACNELTHHHIPFSVWLEDLLNYHGSDSIVFDLNLLVDDPVIAAQKLQTSGYQDASDDERFDFIPKQFKGTRLQRPSDDVAVNLLSARTWKYESKLEPFPALHSFLDATMSLWLEIPVPEYGDQIQFALHVFCWIMYCYWLTDTNGVKIKSIDYADYLLPEHRELHFDIIEETGERRKALSSNENHQYHVRRSKEIKEGNFIPKPRNKSQFQSRLPGLAE